MNARRRAGLEATQLEAEICQRRTHAGRSLLANPASLTLALPTVHQRLHEGARCDDYNRRMEYQPPCQVDAGHMPVPNHNVLDQALDKIKTPARFEESPNLFSV